MELQLKKERWQCAVTSFAMALGEPVDELMSFIGHDGGEKIFDLDEPVCRQGHHLQELISLSLIKGYAVTPIEVMPAIASVTGEERTLYLGAGGLGNILRFINHLENSVGVVEGRVGNTPHMVAYDHGQIFDPDGAVWQYTVGECQKRGFQTLRLWRIDRIK